MSTNKDCTDKNTIHSYYPLYRNLLKPIKNTAVNVLEIGVFYGCSIKLWYKYFTTATIYGCDKFDRLKFKNMRNNNRIKLYLNENAYSENFVSKHFQDIKFDFIIDDGPHTLESQIKFLKIYSPLLSDNGIMIIEDIQKIEYLEELKKNTPDNLRKYIKTYDLRPIKKRYDDIVFVIDKIDRNKNGK